MLIAIKKKMFLEASYLNSPWSSIVYNSQLPKPSHAQKSMIFLVLHRVHLQKPSSEIAILLMYTCKIKKEKKTYSVQALDVYHTSKAFCLLTEKNNHIAGSRTYMKCTKKFQVINKLFFGTLNLKWLSSKDKPFLSKTGHSWQGGSIRTDCFWGTDHNFVKQQQRKV